MTTVLRRPAAQPTQKLLAHLQSAAANFSKSKPCNGFLHTPSKCLCVHSVWLSSLEGGMAGWLSCCASLPMCRIRTTAVSVSEDFCLPVLADVFADALTCWSSWEAQDGSTAAELAHKSGAQSINAMIQRKLDGQSSGLMAQSFDFDPETGEWIDGDDVCDDAEANVDDNSAALVDDDATAHRQYQTEKGLSKSGRLDESAPLIVPARPSNTTLAAEESISQYGSPQTSRIEAAESLLAMSSPSSSGYGDELRKSAEFNAVLTQGLRCQMKAKGFSGGAYSHDDDMFLEQKIHGKKAVPDVFDGRAALVSSAIVGAVGICALGLRCCFEYYDI